MKYILFLVLFFSVSNIAQAGWFESLKAMIPASTKQASLSDTKIGKGLREALSVGIDKAVARASQEGGYLNNPAIKIRFPENLSMVESGLRKIGMGEKVDAFETRVNKAAEQAAPKAKNILLDALFEMSIEDAENLLKGGDTAATDYFKSKTWNKLHAAFQPKLEKAMSQNQASQMYNQLIAMYEKIPFAQKPQLVSADDYATNKALEGLFHLVGEQEKEIRTNPAARATKLLQTVFGS